MGYDDDTLKPEEDEVLGYNGLTSEVEEDEDDALVDDDAEDDDDEFDLDDEDEEEEEEFASVDMDSNY